MARTIRVVATLSRDRERVLMEQPLDIEGLALLQPKSPLSRALLNGCGMEFYPRSIAVFLDGEMVWRQRSVSRGATAEIALTRPETETVHCKPFADVFSADHVYENEKLASNRAAYEALRNPDPTASDGGSVAEVEGEVILRLAATPPRPTPAPHKQVNFYVGTVVGRARRVRVKRTVTGVPDPAWCAEYCPGGYERLMKNGYVARWAPGCPERLSKIIQ